MNPEREGYISLEEETTSESSHHSASPSEAAPSSPTSAAENMVLSDDSANEIAEAGVLEEPCFICNGSANNNRHWLGWKPPVTPLMLPPRTVTVEHQQTSCLSFQTQTDNKSQYPPRGIEHDEFCRDMNGAPLPRDSEERKNFDRQETFILGDPAASFDRPCGHSYERKYDNPNEGFPVWKKIFAHILHTCGYLEDYDTIYVLVDTRNLADRKTRNPGLPHWPAAVAWWESRLQMTGPMGERTELFLPSHGSHGISKCPSHLGRYFRPGCTRSFVPGQTFSPS